MGQHWRTPRTTAPLYQPPARRPTPWEIVREPLAGIGLVAAIVAVFWLMGVIAQAMQTANIFD